MEKENQHNVDFIAFEKDKFYTVSGRILFSNKFSKTEEQDIKRIHIEVLRTDVDNV